MSLSDERIAELVASVVDRFVRLGRGNPGVLSALVSGVISTALEESEQWIPIESCPKGKPGFLAIDQDETAIEWLIDHGGDRFLNQNSSNYTLKRHWKGWRPLPAPPAQEPK